MSCEKKVLNEPPRCEVREDRKEKRVLQLIYTQYEQVSMSLIIVETTTDRPITAEMLADKRLLDCLGARNGKWRYSLLSADRQRMICTFDSPDTESVRESYRKVGVAFERMWTAEMRTPETDEPQWNETALTVFEATYPQLTEDEWNETNRHILAWYAQRGVEWVRSYVSIDSLRDSFAARTRVISELNAPDTEVIREAYRQFGLAGDRVWCAQVLKP
jgi:Protein of unknown function (DUF4242)